MGLKLYKVRFVTANKTVEDLQKDFGGENDAEWLQAVTEAFRALDGIEAVVTDANYSPDTFGFFGVQQQDDAKFKELVWALEQDEMFGYYKDNRVEFDADWDSGEYEPPGALHFNKSNFEVIERILTASDKLEILNSIPIYGYEIEDNEVSSVICKNTVDNRTKINGLGYSEEEIEKFVVGGGYIEMLKFATKIAQSARIVEGVFVSWTKAVA